MSDVHQAFRSWNLHCRLNREALEAERDDEAALAARTRRSHAVKPRSFGLGQGAFGGRSGAKAGPRSSAAARAGLATGSQAAVVKLASYAAGGARLGALLKYQSRDGDLALEREDGGFVQGMSEIRELAAEFCNEGEKREPSKDVLYFVVKLSERPADDDLERAIGQALSGHKFAWRTQERNDETEIHLVTTAASVVRCAEGRAERIFANKKSLGVLHEKLETAFQTDVGFEERGWAHGVEGAARLLCRLTQDGATVATTSSGGPVDSHEANWVVANAWKRALRSREQRDAAHIILSAKPGTDPEAFLDAARATLRREFSRHAFAFALHTDRKHLHVHAVVQMTNDRSERMDPKIPDLRRWRETMAEEARRHHIPMEATSRFEKANSPAYKLRDVRMIERGDAPESVRRRVDAVRTNAVHVPKRAEGRAHAAKAAAGWQFYSAADSATENNASGSAVVRSPGEAGETGQGHPPRGKSIGRDSDTGAAQLFRQRTASAWALASAESSEQPAREGVVRLDTQAPASSMAEGSHGAGAPRQDKESVSHKASKGRPMPNVEIMASSRQAMLDILDEALPLLPDEMRVKIAAQAQKLRDRTQVANDAAERIESRRATLSGAPYDPPRSLELPFFAHAKKSVGGLDEVQYTRVAADGRVGALAFVDKGGQVVVHDWKNEDAVRAAMKLASEKWGAITLTGNEKYKELAIRIAAESGYEITNPELRERFTQAKARVVEARQSAAATTAKSSTAPNPVVTSTPGERAIALEAIHEGIDREARRETRQARVSTALGDDNPATGDAAHPYRSPAAADAARRVATSEDNNPDMPIPVDPAQSQTIERAAAEQKKILDVAASEEGGQEKLRMEKLRAAARAARTRDDSDEHGQEM
jgi:hypothetical protein